MSTNDAHLAVKEIEATIQRVQLAICDLQATLSGLSKMINDLQKPLFHANDTLCTVNACLELPLVALNPANFSFSNVSFQLTTPNASFTMNSCLKSNDAEVVNLDADSVKLIREFRNHVTSYPIYSFPSSDLPIS